jgi:signal peptidase I
METAPSKFKGISEDFLSNGMDVRTSTRGSSMYPLISTGDRITISPEKNLGIGNVIVFKRDDQMVCHRLVRVFEKDGMKYYQTRGDSFFNLDEPVTLNQILGKVIRIERKNMSFPRRILLFIYPALKFGRFNAFVINALVKLRAVFNSVIKQ